MTNTEKNIAPTATMSAFLTVHPSVHEYHTLAYARWASVAELRATSRHGAKIVREAFVGYLGLLCRFVHRSPLPELRGVCLVRCEEPTVAQAVRLMRCVSREEPVILLCQQLKTCYGVVAVAPPFTVLAAAADGSAPRCVSSLATIVICGVELSHNSEEFWLALEAAALGIDDVIATGMKSGGGTAGRSLTNEAIVVRTDVVVRATRNWRPVVDSSNNGRVVLAALPNFAYWGDHVLREAHGVTSAVLWNLPKLAEVGQLAFTRGGFYHLESNTLETISLVRLPSVRSIRYGFANHTQVLREVRLAGLGSLETIGDLFLVGSSVSRVELSDLGALRSIGANFACSTPNLSSIALLGTELPNLATIGDRFACGTRSLSEVRLVDLISLETIGDSFLFNSAVSRVVLHDLRALRSVGSDFTADGPNLLSIEFSGTQLPRLATIGDNFASHTKSLVEVRLVGLVSLESIGSRFLFASAVQRVLLLQLPSLRSMGERCVERCRIGLTVTIDSAAPALSGGGGMRQCVFPMTAIIFRCDDVKA